MLDRRAIGMAFMATTGLFILNISLVWVTWRLRTGSQVGGLGADLQGGNRQHSSQHTCGCQ